MSEEGVRAWIAEVERKLGRRTRVFLALAVIAIGLGGAAIYLAIDAKDSSVSEADVQALQEKLEARIDEVAAGSTAAATPPVEPESAPAPEGPQSKPQSGATGGAPSRAEIRARLQRLLQQARERAEAEE
jgi:hypothetical protein